MKKSLIDRIKLRIALWKFGIKKSDLRKMYENTKYIEEHQPRPTFNLKERICVKS